MMGTLLDVHFDVTVILQFSVSLL